jgi:hypothetical protein
VSPHRIETAVAGCSLSKGLYFDHKDDRKEPMLWSKDRDQAKELDRVATRTISDACE